MSFAVLRDRKTWKRIVDLPYTQYHETFIIFNQLKRIKIQQQEKKKEKNVKYYTIDSSSVC